MDHHNLMDHGQKTATPHSELAPGFTPGGAGLRFAALDFARQQMAAAQTLLDALGTAPDASTILALQNGYFQDQLRTVNTQAQEMRRLAAHSLS